MAGARTPVMVKVLGALMRPGATVMVMAAGFRPGARKVAPGPTVKVKGRVRYSLTLAVRTRTSARQAPDVA